MVAVPEVLNQSAATRPVRDGARIDVRHVSHQFALRGAALPVLQDVSFTVEPGEFVALLGPSGCGKSTLLRLVAGLDTPTQGSVQADGAAIAGPDPSRVVVFQDPTLYPWRTVRGNVGVGPQAQRKRFARRNGPQEDQAEQRIDAALELVGLSEFAEAFPHQLSGGMAQRVALARALVNDPALLVLDEPFGKLDSLTRIRMQGELARLWLDARFSVLLVTHDVEEALLLADRVIVFSERPARVVAEVRNDAPYPRHRDDPKLVALRREVLAQLGLDT
ncbi:Nitrate import ATP-binding protein NrtD [Paraburkholderia aspalathi]|jgi:NitT/TauT family transport system ATP-binding protein|uniref:Nitrate import ATP-binding protein NrtD n=1 Tax=Paraburkholderia aspalathi TaxID=1324617 RepID=A0ABN7KWY0_9BURK|nr:ABC transporter ATP-binding protein [Paraburkholderia aspalathi]MCP2087653.1 NitT/TauT family transport system ATP-binding protein [Paraburkholderia sediminicola]MBK3818026.1 ABC transporter ATP-binding protein [Paraburkholderia aspalathi]MBK3829877.1 ABC transporter ATP-binding protein [Paraburkholderia aspalathi]MBK3859698.1 ABC transporter ATP-binding protein [Paraburkholderia aspalathi]CAE6717654.1 Nitrate import ATP-binding protein NrtD [Paraburkholderia aspalathi]